MYLDDAIALPVCATEDSTDCFWDATQSGNLLGKSFFEYDGITVSVYVPKDYFIESVHVDPEHFMDGHNGSYGYGVTFAQPDALPAEIPTPAPSQTVAATQNPEPLAESSITLAPVAVLVVAAVAVALVTLAVIGLAQLREGRR